MDKPVQVWIARRKTKGKPTYHLRWICPDTHMWKSRSCGGDRRRAEYLRGKLEQELRAGTYCEVKPISWEEFARDHVSKIQGDENRRSAEIVMRMFGEYARTAPRNVTYRTLEGYVEHLRALGRSPATINKHMRYLRAAFRKAVRRGYLGKNPMDGWRWEREEEVAPRVVSHSEESRLLAAARRLSGFRCWCFIYAAVNTGARRGELLSLTWDRVDLDAGEVLFTQTKGRRDRAVPIPPGLVRVLRRLRVQTQREGGPFVGMEPRLWTEWPRITRTAGCPDVTVHDLRRTYCTRLIQAGVPLPTVQKLMGHATIVTTTVYYNAVNRDDLRAGVEMLRQARQAAARDAATRTRKARLA